jgi:pimeloyl-ACP methyl ester carboxylesterase
MKRAFKIIGKVLLAIIILLIFFVLIVFIYNRIMLRKEKPLLEEPLGKMIEVDGYNMCIYSEGEGEHTLVFLSGSGTASPILDFRSLYSLLSDDYRIVVIEKFGYGFSDIVNTERSFDTLLRQDREALSKAGIDAPFVLCPHSMSGLEAILWAQEYPDEVEAIVGLDMSLPRAYDNFDLSKTERFEKIAAIGREIGIVRLYYSDSLLPQGLSEDEKRLYRAIGCKIAVNDAVINEGFAIPGAVEKIDGVPKPDIPMLMYVSDGKETGIEKWVDIQKEYASELSNATAIELDCGHYVHNYKQEQISKEMKEFINKI